MRPTVHLYSICWNEEEFLEFFFKHYNPIVDEYHFYDDGSNDKTLQILKSHPKVHIYPFEDKKDSYVFSARELHNKFWKNSRNKADWVIITAVDELLYHPDLTNYLKECSKKEVTAIPAIGFQMISSFYPKSGNPVTSQIKSGSFFKQMNKLSIFNPQEVIDTNFVSGRHKANPKGNIVYPEKDEILNLHYKYLSKEKTFERHKELNNKLRDKDKERNFGHRYRWSKDKFLEDWDYFQANAIDNVFDSKKVSNYLNSIDLERWWHTTAKK